MNVISIVLAILIFSALILVHELGHYIFARIFKVGIKEFSIGMGPKLFSKTSKKNGIDYSIRLFPIGGFVSMVGEDEHTEDVNAVNRKPLWQRFLIMSAGSIMNILIGIIMMTSLVLASGSLYSTTIDQFKENAASAQSGLMAGDRIIKINDTKTHISYDLVYAIMREGYEPVSVTVIRNGQKITISGVSFWTETESGILYGAADFYVMPEGKNVFTIIKHSFYQSGTSIKLIWQSLFDLLSGRYGIEQVSGPVGVTTAIGDAAKQGTGDLVYLTALIALNLGIFNLLPLPALDGGRLVFLVIELIRRKPIKPEYEGYVHFAGIVILLLLMIVITYKDLVQLFVS